MLQVGEGNYFRSGLAFYVNNVTDPTTDWSEALRISSNSNVGIGITAPTQRLHVVGSNSGTGGYTGIFENATNGTSNGGGYLIQNNHSNHSWGAVAEFRTLTGSGGADRPSVIFSSDKAAISWSVGFVTGSDNNFRISKNHGHRAFEGSWANTNGGWGQEYLTINTDGNVGIGTSAPAGKLHVVPTVGGYGSIVSADLAATGVGAKIENTNGGANSYAIHSVQSPYPSVSLVASNDSSPTGTAYSAIEVGSTDFYIRGGQTNKDIYIATNYNQNAVKVSGADKSVKLYSVVASTSTTTGALVVDGGVGIAGNVNVSGTLSATSKSFLIDHPTKPGMKLRYGSLEGPENGVYIRGKLKGKNKIELPEYWTKLVDPDSITVTLTPIGMNQKLYVADISNNVVTVANEYSEINCFFVVYGERVDIDKLVVEIE